MAVEPVRVHTRDKQSAEAEAEVVRYSTGARLARAIPAALGGVLLGAGSIVIPVAHLVLPWLLPILGLTVAVVLYRTAVRVPEIRGECPACGAAFTVEGGPLEDPMWVRCNECRAPLRVELSAPPG